MQNYQFEKVDGQSNNMGENKLTWSNLQKRC